MPRREHCEFALIGGRGMLGRAWQEALTLAVRSFRVLDRPEFDLLTVGGANEAASSARVVVNCAAWTDVDAAEVHEAEATALNGDAVGELARACKAQGATLLHYSTDYVFSGQASTPYHVTAKRDPVNAYGRSKARGEELLLASGANSLLIRTSWLYASWGKNFVRTIARLSQERSTLRIVNDQRGRPSSALGLVETSLRLLDGGLTGVFHGTDSGECTWYELARAIVEQLERPCEVLPCSSEQYPTPAQRPHYSVLDLTETIAALGRPIPSWQERLSRVLARLEP